MLAAQLIAIFKLEPCSRQYCALTPSFSFLRHILCCICLMLCLFACSSREKPAPVVNVYSSIPLKERVKNEISSLEYQVKPGETLYSIAWRANSDVRKIATINKLLPPYNIYPGQKLFLTTKNSQKTTKVRQSQSLSKKQTISSNQTSGKPVKKTLASTKKQAYGENVNKKKSNVKKKKSNEASLANKASFSQKISQWQWPVQGSVVKGFSSKAQGNKGINIAGRRGTKIKAAANGKVVYAGSGLRGYGKLVIIKHNDDYLSAYAHNDALLVKEQQYIKAGDYVAKMGDTDSQRVMLHFEVRFRGKSVNPLKYLPKR